MALGLGFNKTKILQTAEKYVLQGKLTAAIDEYQKILKKDPKDLMTLNTVGDLYIRAGKTEDALKCFYGLAEKSIEAGFVPRAIAVYKRITKIDVEALPALTKLGELYSMQGLMRDARTHYLQAVEIYMRRRESAKAREIFEKVLMLDMENPRLQRRMAELYAETGKKAEAVATYLSAAERFLDTREPAEAATTLDTLMKLDAENAEAQVLRGRVLLDQGDARKAIETLEAVAAHAPGKAVLDSLFHAYRRQGDLERATEIARRLFEEHEDFAGLAMLSEDLITKADTEAALSIYQGAAERLQSQGAFPVLIDGLRRILKAEPSNIAALELLWGVNRRTGEIGEGRETAEQLAQAYLTSGQLTQARDVYAELVALEPDNAEHVRVLRELEARLGIEAAAAPESPAEPTPLIAMEAAAAPEEESTRVETLPPREQALVKNWLTESELYVTYHQMQRAIETLETGLQEVPGNASLYEHLLPLYEQTQQYQKAAQAAEALTEAYVKMGDGERAARYGELIVGYQQKAKEAGGASIVEVPLEMEPAEPEPATPAAEQPQVREIDLSMEWASLSESGAQAATATAESIAEEIEFYLQAGLVNEAAAAIGRLGEASPEHPALAGFEERLAALLPAATPSAGETAAESAPPEVPRPDLERIEPAPAVQSEPLESPVLVSQPDAEPETTPPEAEPELVLDEILQGKGSGSSPAGFELSLEESSAAEPAPAVSSKQPLAASPEDRVGTLAGELHGELPSPPPAPAPSAGFLDDIFAEFKQEVGESAAPEDLETHYNMGVAFKEMALYDEAIGEFQKVHQLAESAKDYSHMVQCCSLLATCFLEKGMPQLAVQWYQTALNAPGVDAESALALSMKWLRRWKWPATGKGR